MKPVDRYLQIATRGLWGNRRRALRQELESDIFERVRYLTAFGLSEHEAEQRALAQLGSAHALNRSLLQVHAQPALARGAIATGLIAAFTVGPLAGSVAHVNVISPWRTPCQESAPFAGMQKAGEGTAMDRYAASWHCPDRILVDLNALEPALVRQGVRVERGVGMYKLRFPGGDRLVTLPGNPAAFNPRVERNADLEALLFSAGRAGLPVTVRGWHNPVVTIGQVRFTLGTQHAPFQGAELYHSFLTQLLTGPASPLPAPLMRPVQPPRPGEALPRVALRVPSTSGRIVALVGVTPERQYRLSVAPVGPRGRVHLPGVTHETQFVARPAQLLDPSTGHLDPQRALLLEVTEALSYSDLYPLPDSEHGPASPVRVLLPLPS